MATTTRTSAVETRKLPHEEWKAYFDRLSRRYLKGGEPESATIEVVSPSLGDQFETDAAGLLGITYDPRENVFELQLEGIDHFVFQPAEIWVMEGEDGFLSALEVVSDDGTKEIVYFRKSNLSAGRQEPAGPPV